jgi:hypothetical protein
LKAVQIHLAAGQEALQDVDSALSQIFGDRRFGRCWEPVVGHSRKLSSDARPAASAGGSEVRSLA